MRRVDRSQVKAPQVLVKEGAKGSTELETARTYFRLLNSGSIGDQENTPPAAPTFRAYKDESVKHALEKLFHGKCAYCESRYASQAPVDVEHYRPKGRIAGFDDHTGYWWLAMQWENLLPSCIDCNRRRWQNVPELPISLSQLLDMENTKSRKFKMGKQDFFPISGTRAYDEDSFLVDEKPDLLNPCEDVPEEDIVFYLNRDRPLALVLPRQRDGIPSRRGLISIQVYGLNRLGLVQERTQILRKLEFLAHLVDQLHEVADQLDAEIENNRRMAAKLRVLADKVLSEIREMAADNRPYCSLVRAWIRALKEPAPSAVL